MPAPPCIRRQQHNPHQLKCTHGCRKWFKTSSGRTRHIRSFHNLNGHYGLNPDEAVQLESSPPPPEDKNSSRASPQNFRYTPRSRLSTLDVRHGEQFIFYFTHTSFLTLNLDEAIQSLSSPPPDASPLARNSQYTPRSRLSPLDVPHGNIPVFDDPLFNDDPRVNEAFDDLPARNESLDEIHHPLINGAYTIIISCSS